jgi:2-polyprenyl-3-methyl-5-hydroxy-6-metoxy-1,4-benzoquinol methylase
LSLSGADDFIVSKLTTQRKSDSVTATTLERNCPVCDASANLPHWSKGELQLVRCSNCEMVYVNPVQHKMASGEFYYTEGADYYLSPAKLASDYADVRFERELRQLRQFCPRGSVLDVGCGSGGFLFQLKKRWQGDYDILGTDVSDGPLDYAESQGVPVLRGNFLEQDFGGQKFDAVTLWAVAEHLAEPNKFLAQIHAALKPGGVCFVLVPNLRSLAVRLLGGKYRYVYAQHLNYFSAATLGRLGGRVGFEVVATRYTHFNPVVIWQDWRGRGRDVSNAERGELLKQTTALKQKLWMKPVKLFYGLTEQVLGSVGLADNVVLVFQKR